MYIYMTPHLRHTHYALRCSSPAIAAFCLEQDDLYIVVYGGRKGAAGGDFKTPSAAVAAGGGGSVCYIYDGRLRLLCRIVPCESEVRAYAHIQ